MSKHTFTDFDYNLKIYNNLQLANHKFSFPSTSPSYLLPATRHNKFSNQVFRNMCFFICLALFTKINWNLFKHLLNRIRKRTGKWNKTQLGRLFDISSVRICMYLGSAKFEWPIPPFLSDLTWAKRNKYIGVIPSYLALNKVY